jgi:archaeosine synthase beta-subunit
LAVESFSERELTDWILAQRPGRESLPRDRPHGLFLEEERSAAGRVVLSGCILLTNKECPWRCLMCDLWKNTLTESVPSGAIPEQIRYGLRQFASRPEQLKLYNSGSFFDQAAIPRADYQAIAGEIIFAQNIIVESHPRLIGKRIVEFQKLLSNSLEVAMGLETSHPQILPRLNKRFTLADFARAAEFLRSREIAMRAFVLVQPPFMREEESVEWAIKSASFAFDWGATAISLIPTRPGNGALEKLMEAGDFTPPRLAVLEQAQQIILRDARGRVFADTWDLEQFSTCPGCFEPRRHRLQQMNLTQKILPAIDCAICGGR